jgi:DHA1 family bicyclomycin/chloramphenicol resistance-like MFS transporter
MYLPALPSLSNDLAAGASLVQLSLTSCLLGLALGQVVAGPISDRRGRRPVLLAGLAAFVLTSALCALVPNAELLVVVRFFQGAAGAVGIVVTRAVVRDLYSGRAMGRIFTRLMLVSLVAAGVGPLFGAQLLHFTSWRGLFVVLVVIGAVLLAGTAAFVPETLKTENKTGEGVLEQLRVFRSIMRDRAFVVYSVALGGSTSAFFCFLAGSPFVVQDVYGASAQVYSVIFALSAGGQMVVGVLNTRWLAFHGLQTLVTRALIVQVIGAVATMVVVSVDGLGLAAFVPAALVVTISFAVVMPNVSALAMSGYARAAGAASALLGVISMTFGGLVTPLVGIGGKGTAVPMGIVMLASTVLALCLLALLPRRAPVGAHPAEAEAI